MNYCKAGALVLAACFAFIWLTRDSSQPPPTGVALGDQQEGESGQQTSNNDQPRTELDDATTDAVRIPADRVSAEAPQADFPTLTMTNDGAHWVSYLQWNRGETDRVVVQRKAAQGGWSDPIELADGCFEHFVPALAARGKGVLVVWSGHNDKGFDLYTAQVAADGTVSPIKQLTDAPNSDMNVRCASDSAGNVTVVWQSFRNHQADIYACQLRGNPEIAWASPFFITYQ